MSFKKKVLPFLLIVGLVFSGVLGISSTKAFAMDSKGSSKVAFHTDANTYSKNATTIVVYGLNPNVTSVELYKKGNNKAVKILSVYDVQNYKVSFSLKGLSAGQYDVCVYSSWASARYAAELKHYLTVQR
ncbi:hypothetical protein [Listeria booriae]|uniref:hypothetical protein n=1 Tax=Listeria booriae TaxID=1552123 RepID=UPI00164ECA8C|nr:hypothetical protein [Listeria booriae]MBC6300088.1 hypothetical protein [Listeria booriae]